MAGFVKAKFRVFEKRFLEKYREKILRVRNDKNRNS